MDRQWAPLLSVSLAAASGAWGFEFAGDPGPGPWAGLDAGGGGRSARVWLRAAKERTAKVTLKRQLGPGGRAEGRELFTYLFFTYLFVVRKSMTLHLEGWDVLYNHPEWYITKPVCYIAVLEM